jgi:hypothetical protein
MGGVKKILSETGLVLTVVVMMTIIGGATQVADAPPLEVMKPDDIPCYQIDDDGKIIDSNGRERGWVKGNEVYSPGLVLRYRLSGRRLEDIP